MEIIGVVGIEAMISCPLEDGGGNEAARGLCCSLDGRRGFIIRGGVIGDE